MAFEVAALHATLGFRTEGAEAAARATRGLTEEVSSLERVVEGATDRVAGLGIEAEKVVERTSDLEGIIRRFEQAEALVKVPRVEGAEEAKQILVETRALLESPIDVTAFTGANEEVRRVTEIAKEAIASEDLAIQALGFRMLENANKAGSWAAAHADALSTIEELGSSASTVGQDIAGLTVQIEKAGASTLDAQQQLSDILDVSGSLAEMEQLLAKRYGFSAEQLNKLGGIAKAYDKVLNQGIATVMERIAVEEELKATRDKLIEARDTALEAPGRGVPAAERARKLADSFEDVKRASQDMSSAGRTARNSFRLTQTATSGLVTALRTGRIGSALLAQGLTLLASTAGQVAIVLGAVAIAGFKFASQLVSGVDALNRINPKFVELAENMERIEGISLAETAKELERLTLRFESFGIQEAETIATDVSVLGEQLALISGQDPARVIKELERALTSGSFETLREELGADFGKLEERIRAAGEEMTNSERAAAIYSVAVERVKNNSDLAAEAAQRNMDSLAGVGDAMLQVVQEAGMTDILAEQWQNFAKTLREFLVLARPLIKFFSDLATIVLWLSDQVMQGAVDVTRELVRALSFLLDSFAVWLPFVREAADDLRGFVEELDRARSGVEDIDFDQFNDGAMALDDIRDSAERAETVIERFRNEVSEMSSTLGVLRSLGQAFADITDGLDPGEATSLVQAYGRALSDFAEQGSDAVRATFDAQARLIQNLFDMGEISVETYGQALQELQAERDFAEPVLREVEKLEEAQADATEGSETMASTMRGTLAPAVSMAGNNMETAEGQARGFADGIATAREEGAKGITVPINFTGNAAGGGGFLENLRIPGIEGVQPAQDASRLAGERPTFTSTRELPGTSSLNRPSLGAPPSLEDEVRAIRGERVFPTASEQSANFNDLFGIGPGGGGGGGGGGGRDDRLATIEEIKAFFNQVNKAILSGIRGGRVFSLAGNAIPLGGPGQFVSSQGGTLIGQVNLRGVWDFADPAAKREVVRQLREALADIGSEVA